MKAMVRMATVGSVVGGLMTSWLAPKAIAWYFKPPVEMPVNCTIPIEWALHKLQLAQLFGTIGGGVIFLLLSLMFFKGKGENLPETL
jgi:hypothetical protein